MIVERKLWVTEIDAKTLGIPGAVQIFLFEHQRSAPNAKKSLPDWQRMNIRNPTALIRLLMG